MQVRGPEGEQDVRDEKGKPVKGGMRVAFKGYHAYVRSLMSEAGIVDAEVEAMVDEWLALDRSMARLERFMGANS